MNIDWRRASDLEFKAEVARGQRPWVTTGVRKTLARARFRLKLNNKNPVKYPLSRVFTFAMEGRDDPAT